MSAPLPGGPTDALAALRRLGAAAAYRSLGSAELAEGQAALACLASLLAGQADRAAANGAGPDLRYRELFEFSPEAFLTTDLRGVVLEANFAAALLLGCRKEFIVGKPLAVFVEPGQRSAYYALLTRVAHGGTTAGGWPTRLQPLRGQPVEVVLSAAASELPGQPALRWLARDARAQTRDRQALWAERGLANAVLEGVGAFVLVLDEAGVVQRANAHLREAGGWAEADLLGRAWERLLPEEDGPAARAAVRLAVEEGRCPGWTSGLLVRGGERRTVSWAARAFFQPDLKATVVVAVGHDITDLLEGQRLSALGQMAASLAHEGRNLLQRGLGCLERLAWRLEGQPEALELLARARQTQVDLARLFDDVRASAGPLRLELAECDLAGAWREAWAQAQAACPERRAELAERVESAGAGVRGDGFRLTQVFRNLFENSFAAGRGPVRVEVRCGDADLAGRPALRVAVRDNGTGLSAETRRRLFEPFYTTRPEGTGLGTTIARRIVEAHGGTIAAGDHGPPGAEITIVLPREGP